MRESPYGAEPAPAESEYDDLSLIRVWDLATHEPVGAPIDTDGIDSFSEIDLDVSDLAVVTDGSEPLLVGIVGSEWASGLTAWSLQTRRPERSFTIDSVSDVFVTAVVPVTVDGQPAIVAMLTDDDQDDGELVCVWNARTGDRIGQPWHVPVDGRGTAMTAAVVSGRPVVAVYTPDDRIWLCQLPNGAPIGALPVADVGKPEWLHAGHLGGSPVLRASHPDGVVTIWGVARRRRLATIDGLGGVNDLLVTLTGLIVAATDTGLTAIRLRCDRGRRVRR